MINIVCWKWEPHNGKPHPKKNITFTGEHVNRLYRMLARNVSQPFRLFCFTDNPSEIIPDVHVIPLWTTYREMGGCYIRLPIFGAEMRDIIGEDFFSIDLDVVITRDITSLLHRTRCDHDFKIWGDTNPTTPYNGSFFYMKAGARSQVSSTFNPRTSPILAQSMGYVGTDQAWIGACLGDREPRWTTADGVFSYRVHCQHGKRQMTGAEKIIFFHGSADPSKAITQEEAPWVAEHWR